MISFELLDALLVHVPMVTHAPSPYSGNQCLVWFFQGGLFQMSPLVQPHMI